MSMTHLVCLAVVGLAIGVISGMLGIGGGVLVIPALMFFFGFSQREAIGTSLGMLLPPIGIFAFLTYWHAGSVRIDAAAILAITFALGAWGGSLFVTWNWVSESAVRIIFASFLVYIACNLFFRSEPRVRAAFETLVVMIVFVLIYAAARISGRRWQARFDSTEYYARRLARGERIDYEI